ncbi:MAG: hypothetical protein HY360_05825 [Verrucomicrobia bacterium]|nr:hypothetical protein [Verrucomicrobiota bacterium]
MAVKMNPPEDRCQVCGVPTENYGPSSFGAFSFSMCEDCEEAGRQPWADIVGFLWHAGLNTTDNLDEHWGSRVATALTAEGKTKDDLIRDLKVAQRNIHKEGPQPETVGNFYWYSSLEKTHDKHWHQIELEWSDNSPTLLWRREKRLQKIEPELKKAPCVVFHTFKHGGRELHLALTEQLRKKALKDGTWGSREMLITLKNAAYGFDRKAKRSRAGRSGIFLLDRSFQKPNPMMRKIFDRFLDKKDGGAKKIAQFLDVPKEKLVPVRLVSHHMRLVGVLVATPKADWLVLVDCDRSI